VRARKRAARCPGESAVATTGALLGWFGTLLLPIRGVSFHGESWRVTGPARSRIERQREELFAAFAELAREGVG
jgi:hypothetical protein